MKTYFDLEGDGGSHILEQVQARRQKMAERLAGVRQVLAIASGKGGVGKSTLTVELARALTALGQRCAVLDADLNGPCQARLAGLQSVPLLPGPGGGVALPTTADGIAVLSLGSIVPESQALDFDSVAHGDSFTWRATREFTLLGELLSSVVWGPLDFLLVDLPPGPERTLQYAEFFGPRAVFLLVTLPSALSYGVVARALAALAREQAAVLGYVENMAGYYCADCASIKPLFGANDGANDGAAGSAFSNLAGVRPSGDPAGLRCLGRVPFDPELAARGDRGESVLALAERPAARAICELAAALLTQLEQLRGEVA